MTPTTSYISVTDQFCGAGGSSLGAAHAGCEIKLAMNHWQLAIETHNTNFPDTRHDCADISAVDPRRYPSTDILITSPECTNHSLAKGVKRKNLGQLSLFDENPIDPAAERSRATMWDVVRFAEYHQYNLIIVENVVDARHWVLFDTWLKAMNTLGYRHECVYVNSMFAHPTPQSRDRMYIVFWKRGNKKPDLRITPRAWCERCASDVDSVQAWKNAKKQWGKYGQRNQYVYVCPRCTTIVEPYYYAAANAIDWSLVGERIGDRKKPLKPRTMERIKHGLEKYGKQAMTVQVDYSHSASNHARSVLGVMPTQTARLAVGLVMPFVTRYDGTHQRDVLESMPTLTTRDVMTVVIPPFIIAPNDRTLRARPVNEPLPTQLPNRPGAVVTPEPFIIELRRTGTASDVSEALATVTAGGNHHGLVMPFLASYYNGQQDTPITDPVRTVTTVDRHALVQPESLDVDDCYFRMLQSHEIGAAMAFPQDYVVMGNSRDRVRQYGNAVTPPVMEILIKRCVESLQ